LYNRENNINDDFAKNFRKLNLKGSYISSLNSLKLLIADCKKIVDINISKIKYDEYIPLHEILDYPHIHDNLEKLFIEKFDWKSSVDIILQKDFLKNIKKLDFSDSTIPNDKITNISKSFGETLEYLSLYRCENKKSEDLDTLLKECNKLKVLIPPNNPKNMINSNVKNQNI